MTPVGVALVNQRTGEAVAHTVEVAVTRRDRRKGLLGRSDLPSSTALILAPCGAIHTMFMRFAIDAVFVDEDGRVVKIVPELAPWRIAAAALARAVVEMPARSLRACPVSVGDRLYLRVPDGRECALAASDLRTHLC